MKRSVSIIRPWALSLVALVLAMALALPVTQASAARVGIVDFQTRNDPTHPEFTPVCNLYLKDEIRIGDYERVKAKLDEFRLSPARPVGRGDKRETIASNSESGYYALCLSGPGGDINEALRIGDLFTQGEEADTGWMMVVEARQTCVSACAMLFMTAKRRTRIFAMTGPGAWVQRGPGRWLHYSATLGFHAPRLVASGDADRLTPEQVSAAYARALRTIASVVFRDAPFSPEEEEQRRRTGEIGSRAIARVLSGDWFAKTRASQSDSLHEYIPNDLLLAIMGVPPDEMLVASTIGQMLRWGIEPYGMRPPRHISERMAIVGCANLLYMRCILGGPLTHCSNIEAQNPFSAREDIVERDDGRADSISSKTYFAMVSEHFRSSAVRVWPRRGERTPLEVVRFTLQRRLDGGRLGSKLCLMRIAYRDGKLLGIEGETFNGQSGELTEEILALTPGDAQVLAKQPAADGRHYPWGDERTYFRPWLMLPSGKRLADLDGEPWSELEKGGPLQQQVR